MLGTLEATAGFRRNRRAHDPPDGGLHALV
jgi:hypothetical protein